MRGPTFRVVRRERIRGASLIIHQERFELGVPASEPSFVKELLAIRFCDCEQWQFVKKNGEKLQIGLLPAKVRIRLVRIGIGAAVRITSKGQVTIPQEIREQAGLLPATEVEFEITKAGILIKKSKGSKSFGSRLIKHMRGTSDTQMSTDEIMALTRG